MVAAPSLLPQRPLDLLMPLAWWGAQHLSGALRIVLNLGSLDLAQGIPASSARSAS